MATTTKAEIEYGQVGFGTVNNFPPARWRFEGKRAGAWIVAHVKHPSQSTAYPDQGVDWATVERIMAG